MTRRRFRKPTAKPGELKACWGKTRDDGEDVFYINGGAGARSEDRALLCSAFNGYFTGSLEKELKARGYDMTTLKFSIRRLTATPPSSSSPPSREP